LIQNKLPFTGDSGPQARVPGQSIQMIEEKQGCPWLPVRNVRQCSRTPEGCADDCQYPVHLSCAEAPITNNFADHRGCAITHPAFLFHSKTKDGAPTYLLPNHFLGVAADGLAPDNAGKGEKCQ